MPDEPAAIDEETPPTGEHPDFDYGPEAGVTAPPAAAAAGGELPAEPAGEPAATPIDERIAALESRFTGQLDDATGRLRQSAADNERLREIIRVMAGGAARPAGEPENEQDKRARDRLYQVDPRLAPGGVLSTLAEKLTTDQVDKLLAGFGRLEQQEQSSQLYYDRYTDTVMTKVYDQIATSAFGDPGKTGKDLDKLAKRWIDRAFLDWLQTDETGKRVERYEGFDEQLPVEFASQYLALHGASARRQAAAVQTRAQAVARLPVQGSGAPPPTSPPPKPNHADEDAVHDHAWDQAQAMAAR